MNAFLAFIRQIIFAINYNELKTESYLRLLEVSLIHYSEDFELIEFVRSQFTKHTPSRPNGIT